MDYVRGKIVIFHEILITTAMGLLLLAGVWDLEKKEIPFFLLCSLSIIALVLFCQAPLWKKIYDLVIVVLLGIGGWSVVEKGKIGGGDIWLLSCFVLIWPVDMFWRSLGNAVVILCMVAMGIWIVTGDEKIQIPMIPFLVLGYWMRGMQW